MRIERVLKLLPFLAVIALALGSSVQLFELHREHFRERWVGAGHDRNAHYRYGLQMAADLKNGDLTRFAVDFDAGSFVWPPLNGLLIGAVSLVAGPSPIWAALPSLTGWFLTVVFAYLLANRALPRFGEFAGCLAAAFVLASPAHRAYSTDIMMESLGAGFSLVALHAFLVWSQERTTRSSAWLGFALTLLFFQKYNYWLLVMFAVVPVYLIGQRNEYLVALRRLWNEVTWRNWLLAQLRRPLNYPIAILLGITLAIALTGGFDFDFNGKKVEVRSNQLFVAVAYALILLRFTIWWWTGGRHIARQWLLPEMYPLLYWHLFPVITWFAIPYRLRTFFWFVSPANTEKEYHSTFLDGVRYYCAGIEGEYVPAPEVFPLLAVGLALATLAILVPRGYRTGGWVVPLFAVVALLLTFKHPNHKLRFLHTGVAGLFVAAPVGVAALFGMTSRIAERPRIWNSVPMVIFAVLVIIGLALLSQGDFGGSGHASEAGLNGNGKSLRTVTDAVVPLIPRDEPVAIFSNVPSKFWATWMYLEHSPKHERLRVDCREVDILGCPTAEQFAAWSAATKSQCVIFVNISPDSPLYEPAPPDETTATVIGFLPGSPFKLVQMVEVPECGTITVWRR